MVSIFCFVSQLIFFASNNFAHVMHLNIINAAVVEVFTSYVVYASRIILIWSTTHDISHSFRRRQDRVTRLKVFV